MELASLFHCSLSVDHGYGHDLAQYHPSYGRSALHDLQPSAGGANFLVRWSMASALFLGSWAALMGPMIYGMSAHNRPRFATSFRLLPSNLVVDLVAVATHAPHAPTFGSIVADH